jgi:insulysin
VGSGGEDHNSGYALFQLDVDLTTQGLNATPGLGLAVAQLLFDYIAMLKEADPQAWIWDEMKGLNETSFRCGGAAAASA